MHIAWPKIEILIPTHLIRAVGKQSRSPPEKILRDAGLSEAHRSPALANQEERIPARDRFEELRFHLQTWKCIGRPGAIIHPVEVRSRKVAREWNVRLVQVIVDVAEMRCAHLALYGFERGSAEL